MAKERDSEDWTTLEGWVMKYPSTEKAFRSKPQSRYFKVVGLRKGPKSELALCYYGKKTSKDPKGWMFFSDMTKVRCEKSIIELVSPSRTLILEPKTYHDLQVWKKGLVKLHQIATNTVPIDEMKLEQPPLESPKNEISTIDKKAAKKSPPPSQAPTSRDRGLSTTNNNARAPSPSVASNERIGARKEFDQREEEDYTDEDEESSEDSEEELEDRHGATRRASHSSPEKTPKAKHPRPKDRAHPSKLENEGNWIACISSDESEEEADLEHIAEIKMRKLQVEMKSTSPGRRESIPAKERATRVQLDRDRDSDDSANSWDEDDDAHGQEFSGSPNNAEPHDISGWDTEDRVNPALAESKGIPCPPSIEQKPTYDAGVRADENWLEDDWD